MSQGDLASLPLWRSHKEVRAAKVVGIEEGSGLALCHWVLETGHRVPVDQDLALRVTSRTDGSGRNPIGGLFVLYEDGHRSWWSLPPSEPFTAGYRRVTEDNGNGNQS